MNKIKRIFPLVIYSLNFQQRDLVTKKNYLPPGEYRRDAENGKLSLRAKICIALFLGFKQAGYETMV